MSSRRRHRWAVVVAGFAVVVLGALVAVGELTSGEGSRDHSSATEGSGDSAVGADAPVDALASVPAGAYPLTVGRIVDGDTIRGRVVRTPSEARASGSAPGESIRLIGIDTPELAPVAECGAAAARDQLRALLPTGSQAWAMPDAEAFDRYGRGLLYLWNTNGVFVNRELVADGWARPLTIEPNTRFATEFSEAEQAARADNRGLWSGCPP